MRKKPNVLFVDMPTIPLRDVEAALAGRPARRQPVAMPLGILHLSSAIKSAECAGRVAMVPYALAVETGRAGRDIDGFVVDVAEEAVDFEPDVLAFSLIFSASYAFFERCLAVLKRRWPETCVIVGGVHASNTVEHLLLLPGVDYVCRGEGEIALVEFLRRYAEGDEIGVSGIHGRAHAQGGAALSMAEIPRDLDALPFPDWDLLDMEAYVTAMGRQREIEGARRHASLMTTRGCPFRCTFCASHTVHGRGMRTRSAESVIAEMRALNERYGVTLFMPEDDLLTVDKPRILALLEVIRRENADWELQFPDALSVNTLDEEVVDALVAAGMRILVLAIESGSPEVQRRVIKKNCNLPKARRLVEYAKRLGLVVRCYFILGFPKETREQMQETVEFARSLGADWCTFKHATPLVGTEMYDDFVAAGCIEHGPETWAHTIYDERWFDAPNIAADELNELCYRTNLECNFIHNANLVAGNHERARGIFEDIVTRHPFHVVGWYCLAKSHRGLGDEDAAMSAEARLHDMVRTDPRAAGMLVKYADLMPDLALVAVEA